MSKKSLQTLPLLAVRDVIVYPHMQIALFVGREQSIKAIELAQDAYDGELIVVSQKDSLAEEINVDDLYQFGTRCRIVSTMPHDSDDKCLKVLIEGLERVKVGEINEQDDQGSLQVSFDAADIKLELSDDEIKAQKSVLLELFTEYAEHNLRNFREPVRVASNIDDLLELIYFIATRTQIPAGQKTSTARIRRCHSAFCDAQRILHQHQS